MVEVSLLHFATYSRLPSPMRRAAKTNQEVIGSKSLRRINRYWKTKNETLKNNLSERSRRNEKYGTKKKDRSNEWRKKNNS